MSFRGMWGGVSGRSGFEGRVAVVLFSSAAFTEGRVAEVLFSSTALSERREVTAVKGRIEGILRDEVDLGLEQIRPP